MSTLQNVLKYVPVLFFVVVLFLLYRLNAHNQELRQDNRELQTENRRVYAKNEDLAQALQDLTGQLQQVNDTLAIEAKRQAAAEQHHRALQNDIKKALQNNRCAVVPVPDDVAERLRQEADRVRTGDNPDRAHTGESAN